ncbi:hypothetical protein P152DRAFT_456108 [Eremomyces bilateralis CBS 781.70]|uniref:Uncharacterized protein n=1 Tax=Eremomyces bilateralis CBS 781.70 TaxID=1392243 RepID=A0A6G1GAM1_9PEZI|nr:uncharacterized protein P152DRAFT_456108 [Eremomyces bilateralis CBS 781.70]KAF1815074.1 hypothetical protein P152DRAFT_456108 [Eremomyces bilateralis CBS 781.70]
MGDGTTTKPTSLPPCRRYICSHTPDGKSVFLPSPEQIYRGRDGVGGVARSYSVETVPAKLADDQDVKAYLSPHGDVSHLGQNIVVPNLKGSNCLVIDLGPGGESQMHQTVSIDFSICVIGTIDMELDGGERVRYYAQVDQCLQDRASKIHRSDFAMRALQNWRGDA